MDKFHIENYLEQQDIDFQDHPIGLLEVESAKDGFISICKRILEDFIMEWDSEKQDIASALHLQKNAIIGYDKEVSFFKDKINLYLEKYAYEPSEYPNHYESLEDAIYQENWGLAGVSEWFGKDFKDSSSAKIIGDRIYFLEKGKMVLKPQSISKIRREQLIRAFLLLTPEERLDKEFHEVYMLDGTRITIFRGVMTKKDQDAIIFRRYTVPIYTFEEQANRGTIPKEAISLFKNMVDIGYNVAFTGAVRTAKSTFLSTWQSYESQELEGVMVETDPEIPLHQMMKHAPIIQIIADNEKLKAISKNLLRSDADYFIMAEARDGIALDTVLKMAAKGTRRMKITFHSRDPVDFCYDVASEIFKMLGGSPHEIQQKVAKSFDYIFHFIQLADKSQKRLKGIFELGIDPTSGHIKITQICRYHIKEDRWQWQYLISPDKRLAGIEENTDSFITFERELEKLCYESSSEPERSIYERTNDLWYEGNKASEAIN